MKQTQLTILSENSTEQKTVKLCDLSRLDFFVYYNFYVLTGWCESEDNQLEVFNLSENRSEKLYINTVVYPVNVKINWTYQYE